MIPGEPNSGINPADRRPMSSRRLRVFEWVADALTTRGLSPNVISLSTMAFATTAAGLMVLAPSAGPVVMRWACVGAAVFVQLRLFGNLLDGMVAERLDRATLAGRLYNEWPDRFSDIVLLLGFAAMVGEPADFYLGPLAACMAVLTAYARELGRAVNAPAVFAGPMGKPQRMALLTGALLVLAVLPKRALLQWWGPAYRFGLVESVLWLIAVGGVVTAVRRLRLIHRTAAACEGGS